MPLDVFKKEGSPLRQPGFSRYTTHINIQVENMKTLIHYNMLAEVSQALMVSLNATLKVFSSGVFALLTRFLV